MRDPRGSLPGLWAFMALAACSDEPPGPGGVTVDDGGLAFLGPEHAGEYHLGPVEWTGSYHNACSPYPASVQALEGGLLAGVSNTLAGDGSYCDACIRVETGLGRSAVLRVVTYGDTSAPGNIDVSQAAYTQLHRGEYPRAMRWRLVTCPTREPLYLQFQTGANEWWTSLWVRNPRVAVARVEVRSAHHASWFARRRETDGTFNDDHGFGAGAFTLRVVGVNGAAVEVAAAGFQPGGIIRAPVNLP
jgi:hypothetical protein